MSTQEEKHKEFLLAALRAAAYRAKLMENEINTIGLALKGNLIGVDNAVKWVRDAGLLSMVGELPEEVGKLGKGS